MPFLNARFLGSLFSKEMVVAIDALIIGGGVAGLMAALRLAKCKKTVAVLVKTDVTECSTWYAQGGMSAVPSEGGVPLHGDSFDSHVRDTMDAGDGLSDPGVAEHFSRNAMHIIDELIGFGVEFTKSDSGGYTYSLHQEGGHSAPRVFHCADHTGRSVLEVLTAVAQATEHIRIYEHHMAIDLITERRLQSVHAAFGPNGESVVRRSKRRRPAGRPIPRDTCVGVYALDTRTGGVTAFAARVTFLATGGTGRVYLYTSNPDTNTGDGLAMYYRLGYPLRDMEFIQFHPTCFYNPNSKCPDQRRFLITEALRGKNVGGRLTLSRDPPEDFVLRYHRDGSAATRDVVAQAIDTEMKQRGLAHVWLNVTPAVTGVTAQALRDGYPDIFRHCYECGVDLTAEPIPVVPAAHYTCGGIPVDLSGCTQVERLYAVGECASTGPPLTHRLAAPPPPPALRDILSLRRWDACAGPVRASELAKQLGDGRSEVYGDVVGMDALGVVGTQNKANQRQSVQRGKGGE